MSTEREIEFDAAIRWFHFHKKYWKLREKEVLPCSHEFGNPSNVFTIKKCKDDGTIVGYLPREISRASKFLLDREATTHAEVSLCIIEDLLSFIEILCKVCVYIYILKRFLNLVKSNYSETETLAIVGSILTHEIEANTNRLWSDWMIERKKEI